MSVLRMVKHSEHVQIILYTEDSNKQIDKKINFSLVASLQ